MRSPRSRRSVAQTEIPAISPMMEDILQRVEQLSDLDLRKELSARSFSCGPIVGTTRSVYKKKLADMLLDEELPAEARIARAAPSSEDDDDEDEAEEVVATRHVNGGIRSVPQPVVLKDDLVDDGIPQDDENDDDDDQEEDEKVTPISSQEGSSQEEEGEDDEEEESESAVDDDDEEDRGNLATSETDVLRHRLPRASDGFETKTSVAFVSEDGKTVRRTTTTTTRVVKASDLRSDGDAPKPASAPTTTAEQKPAKKKSSCLSLLFQLIVIAIIVFFVYVIVSGPSSPLGLPEAPPHDEENPPVRDDSGV